MEHSFVEVIAGMMNPRRAFPARTRPEGRRTLPNPGWDRSPATPSRGWRRCRKVAADPVPMTRQVARCHMIDTNRDARDWRDFAEMADQEAAKRRRK